MRHDHPSHNRESGRTTNFRIQTLIAQTKTTTVIHIPYLLTIACKEHQACHQRTLHPTDLPIVVCTLLLQVEPSSVYPLQAQQLLAIEIGTAGQFQSPTSTKIANANHTI